MKYFKTNTGYVAIDEGTQINAHGSRIPTNVLAYGRGPTRPNDAESVAARVFDMVALAREGQQIEAEGVPNGWRVALGLVKVEPVCPMPAGKAPVWMPEQAHRPELLVTHMLFLLGCLVGTLASVLR
jgi:hypothetical protein